MTTNSASRISPSHWAGPASEGPAQGQGDHLDGTSRFFPQLPGKIQHGAGKAQLIDQDIGGPARRLPFRQGLPRLARQKEGGVQGDLGPPSQELSDDLGP